MAGDLGKHQASDFRRPCMRYLLAILCALAIIAAQSLYGGVMRPVFALPAYLILSVAGILALSALFWRNVPLPSLACVSSVAAWAGWLFWREANSPDPWLASSYVRLTLACLVIYLLFACIITNPLHRLAFISLLLCFALVQAAFGAWQFVNRHDSLPLPWMSEYLKASYIARLNGRAHGFYLNANHLAWFLNMAGVFALAAAFWGRWGIKTKVLVFYVALMSLAVSVITLSRGGLLALVAGLGVFSMLSAYILLAGARGRRFVAFMVMLGGLAATVTLALYIFNTSFAVQQRFGELLNDGARPMLFSAAARQFQLEPIWGTGAGTFLYYGRQFREIMGFSDDIFAHNDWMQLAADFGFPALALLIMVVLIHAGFGLSSLTYILQQRMSQNSRPQSHAAALLLAALVALVLFTVHSFFDFNMQLPANALLAAACLGVIANGGVEREARISRWLRVLARYANGLFVGGAAIFLLMLTLRAFPAEVAWLRAENALYQRDLPAALGFAKDGLMANPAHPRLHRTVGETYLAMVATRYRPKEGWRQLQEAAQALALAAQLAPLDYDNHLLWADALTRIGRYQEAGLEAQEAIRLNPTQSHCYAVYAAALAKSGRLEELQEAERAYGCFNVLPKGVFLQQEIEDVRSQIRDKQGN